MKRGVALAVLLAAAPLHAADFSWSGFGTLGYARSNRDYAYERFIDNDGTVKRDSLLGLQTTAQLTPKWSATVQATLAPSVSDDQRWAATLPWAFLSYRADNDLLLRAGKLRMPMYLFSENMNVGASFDVMRLPTEVYSTAPTTDYTGASFSKTWPLAAGDLSLDGYAGRTSVNPRATSGSGAAPAKLHTRSAGLVLSLRRGDDSYRLGLQRAIIGANAAAGASGGALPAGSAPVPPMTDGAPGRAFSGDLDARVYLLGADVGVGDDLRLVGEYARRRAVNAVTPKNSRGAYLTLLRKAGQWTPYLTVARLLTDQDARRSASPRGVFDDQSSAALGLSYALTPSSKIKAEWMHVHIGAGSSLIDTAAGAGAVSRQGLNVMSLSYSFSF